MKINIFEGARRIGLAFGGIWVIGCLAFAVFSKPFTSMTYAVEWPLQPATKVESCAKEDATEYAAVKTSKGDSVSVSLCLTAHETTDGRLLVPFSVMHSESNRPRTVTLKEVEGNPFAGDKDSIVWDMGIAAGRDLSAELFGDSPSKTAPVPSPKAPILTADKSSEGRPWEKHRANKEDDSWYKDSPIVTPEKQTAATSVGLPSSPFKGMSDAELLAAYQKEKAQAMNGPLKYLMKERYSSEVMAYGRQVAVHFSLSEDGMKDAEQAVWDARLKQWKEALQFALGGVAFLWAAAAGIGWVVRGFMGIPRGKDTRPA